MEEDNLTFSPERRVIWDDGCGNVLVDFDGLARDAISLLRDPSPEVMGAALRALKAAPAGDDQAAVRAILAAAVDAVLASGSLD